MAAQPGPAVRKPMPPKVLWLGPAHARDPSLTPAHWLEPPVRSSSCRCQAARTCCSSWLQVARPARLIVGTAPSARQACAARLHFHPLLRRPPHVYPFCTRLAVRAAVLEVQLSNLTELETPPTSYGITDESFEAICAIGYEAPHPGKLAPSAPVDNSWRTAL